MSMDRPSSSGDSGRESRPERGDRPADRNGERPFPGAPLDRPEVSPPAGPVRSWDEIKADKQRYTSQAEYEAVLKERAAGTGPPDSAGPAGATGSPGAAGVLDRGTAGHSDDVRDPGGRRPEGAEPGRFERSAERPFPRTSPDRFAMPDPWERVRSWDEIKADKDRFGSQRAYDQARTAEKNDSPGPAREGKDAPGNSGTSGKDASSSPRDAPSKEQAEVTEPSQEEQDQGGDGDRGDDAGHDRLRAVRDEQQPDHGPDQAGDQNWDAIEQRMQSVVDQRIQAALDGVKAEYEAKLDEQKAEYEAEIDGIRAEYEGTLASHESRLGELEGKADNDQPDRLAQSDEVRHEAERPDTTRGDQRGDRLQHGVRERRADDLESSRDQAASLEGHEQTTQGTDDSKRTPGRWRRLAMSENINAAGTLGGTVNTAALFAMHATPEAGVAVGLTVLSVAGLVKAKIEKHREDKNDRPH